MNKCLLPEKCMIFAWFMHEKNKKNHKKAEIWSVAHVYTPIFHEECKNDIENPLPDF